MYILLLPLFNCTIKTILFVHDTFYIITNYIASMLKGYFILMIGIDVELDRRC